MVIKSTRHVEVSIHEVSPELSSPAQITFGMSIIPKNTEPIKKFSAIRFFIIFLLNLEIKEWLLKQK
jgi:hypothetical protein